MKNPVGPCLTNMLSNSHFPLQLKSVFDTSIVPYTNYTYDFKGMIDYVFYPVRSMKPLGYLGPISQEWLDDNKVVGCPHPHITSGKLQDNECIFILNTYFYE